MWKVHRKTVNGNQNVVVDTLNPSRPGINDKIKTTIEPNGKSGH